MKFNLKAITAIILAVATVIAMSGCSGAETKGSETTSTSAVSETTEESAAETTEPGETAIAYDSAFNDAVDPSTKIGRYYAAEDLHFNELYEEEILKILIAGIYVENGVYFDNEDQPMEYYLRTLFLVAYGIVTGYYENSPYYSEYFEGKIFGGYVDGDERDEYDPLNKFNSFGCLYKANADTVDWLIEDVLNGKADHDAAQTEGEGGALMYYYYDGFYYIHIGELGGGGWILSDYTAERLDDGTYDITYHVDDDEIIVHVKAGLIEHDGYYFWSLFSIKVDM